MKRKGIWNEFLHKLGIPQNATLNQKIARLAKAAAENDPDKSQPAAAEDEPEQSGAAAGFSRGYPYRSNGYRAGFAQFNRRFPGPPPGRLGSQRVAEAALLTTGRHAPKTLEQPGFTQQEIDAATGHSYQGLTIKGLMYRAVLPACTITMIPNG